jgi:N utilization substance protein B
MPGDRRKGRQFALQLLHQWEVQQSLDGVSVERFWADAHTSPRVRSFAMALVEGVLAHQAMLERLIGGNLEQWKLSRLPAVVRNVLRLAACELAVIRDVPAPVVINEAVELTRSFMDDESARFVNSVLEKISHAAAASAPPPPTPPAAE